jgi:hypothetical protein
MDVLFFGLAIITAFKLGSGMTAAEEPDDVSVAPAVVQEERKEIAESDLIREPGAAGYCPSCGIQFRSGYQKCPDCGVYVALFLGRPA